jgi:N utilization substance protein B
MIRKRTRARECVLQVLYQLEINPMPLADLLRDFWAAEEQGDLTPDIREFSEEIVRGTLEHLEEIDQIVDRYADNWTIKRMAVIDRNILRFSVYELLFVADIPPKVTINEAVNLAKKFSQEESGKFVNGILDKINHTETPKNPKTNAPPHA